MSFALSLWLLLLHAVAGAPALHVHGAHHANGRASSAAQSAAPWALHAASRSAAVAGLSATVPRLPAETARAARFVAPSAFTRAADRLPLSSVPVLPASPHTARLQFAGDARRVLGVAGTDAHRLASRGGLLPYFPTAPPRRV